MDTYASNKEFWKKDCEVTVNGEKLLCGPFSGCCRNKCCPEDLTFIYVWMAIGIIVGMVLLALFCRQKGRRNTNRIGLISKPMAENNLPVQVVVENEGKVLKVLKPVGQIHADTTLLFDELCGTGRAGGKRSVRTV